MCPTRQHAFTLIELLIVVAIIAILAAIAVPNFLEAQVRAKVSRSKNDLRTVSLGLEAYRVDHNAYPQTQYGVQPYMWSLNHYIYCRIGKSIQGTWDLTTPIAYLTSLPIDPFSLNRADNNGDYPQFSYAYSNFELMSREPWASQYKYPIGPLYGPTPSLRLDFGTTTVNRTPWLLTAYGPDCKSAWASISYNGCLGLVSMVQGTSLKTWFQTSEAFQAYDPSNGTVSFGDIWKTQ